MKFCINCGKQIDDNAPVCGFCGAAQGQGQPAPVYGGGAPVAKSRISIGGIIAAGGYLLMLIALLVPIYSVMGVGVSLRQMTLMGGVYSLLFVVPLILVILGLACAIVSIFTGNKVLLLVVTIIEVIFAVFVIIVLGLARSEIGRGGSFSVGFFMWIIGIIVALVGTIMDFSGKNKQ